MAQRLPLTTRGSDIAIQPPDAAAINKITTLTTRADAAIYFEQAFDKMVKNTGIADSPALREMRSFVQQHKDQIITIDRGQSDAAWSGKAIETERHQLYHQVKARLEVAELNVDEIRMDFAIGDQAEFLRGYSSAGKAFDEEGSEKMDKLFNAWLVAHNMCNEEGVIYNTSSAGDILKDKDQQPSRVDVQVFKDLFMHAEKGLSAFITLQDKSKHLQLVEQPHPNYQAERTIQS